MLVAMVIFSSFLLVAGAVALSVSRQQAKTLDRGERLESMRAALADMDRQIRSGNVLYDPSMESPAYFRLHIYTQANGVEKCVEWKVAAMAGAGGYALQTRSWDPLWSTSGQYTAWRTVSTSLRVVSGDRPFAGPPSGSPTVGRLVNITLKSTGSDSAIPDVTLSTSVTGRNTQYGYDAYACSTPPPGA